MNCFRPASHLCVLLLVVLTRFAATSRADWETNGSCKMHWPQLPDLTLAGMDVRATAPSNTLADD